MLKSGLILGIVTFVLALGFGLLSPLCVPCVALFLGLGAGYLAGVFDKPPDQGAATKSGTQAGALAGVGAILGQAAGSGATAVLVGPEGAADMARAMGLPTEAMANFATTYWAGLAGVTCCFGLLDIALMAGLGALGGLLWWEMAGKNSTPLPPSYEQEM